MLTNITRTNGKRHDTCELRLVARGTPKRLATVIPAIIIDTAPVLWRSSASCTATIEATPK